MWADLVASSGVLSEFSEVPEKSKKSKASVLHFLYLRQGLKD